MHSMAAVTIVTIDETFRAVRLTLMNKRCAAHSALFASQTLSSEGQRGCVTHRLVLGLDPP